MERRYKILIVDEEDEIRSVYGKFLTDHGFEVGTAHRGSEGLKKLREEAFDVALVDLRIPEAGGISMIREVSQYIDMVGVILLLKSQWISRLVMMVRLRPMPESRMMLQEMVR